MNLDVILAHHDKYFISPFFPVRLDLWLGSSRTDSQPGVTPVKCFSWNTKIDLISWLVLVNEQAWSRATAQALVALLAGGCLLCSAQPEVPVGPRGLSLEERSLVFLAANRFDSLKHLTMAEPVP